MAPLLAARKPDRAFERMYRKHVHDVYRYSLAMLRNPTDAEDVTQTTFMNAYRAFERGERPQHAQNWLITIAHNVCRQRFRNASRRPAETEWDDTLAAPAHDEDDDGPTIADVQRALGHLPFNQRSALVMRELEGRSYAEIAEALELTVSAVETLIFRARRALREQIEGALTCDQAELAISKQLDGRLSREERGGLRAHLRECKECARDARRLRAQRAALKGLGAVPLPASLVSWIGGGSAAAAGGTAVGVGLAAKTAAVVAAGAVVAGAGHEIAVRDAPSAAPPKAERGAVAAEVSTPAVLRASQPTVAPAAGEGRPAAAQRAAAGAAKPKPARSGPKKPKPAAGPWAADAPGTSGNALVAALEEHGPPAAKADPPGRERAGGPKKLQIGRAAREKADARDRGRGAAVNAQKGKAEPRRPGGPKEKGPAGQTAHPGGRPSGSGDPGTPAGKAAKPDRRNDGPVPQLPVPPVADPAKAVEDAAGKAKEKAKETLPSGMPGPAEVKIP